jgi:tRNA A37 methylthiotransferase MiaB
VRRRTARLRRLGAARSLAFRRAHVGRDVDVLVLERREAAPGALVGLTGNYLEVAFAGPGALARGFARVRVTGLEGDRLRGEVRDG